jgi:dTDP-4-dehydrorhamnose reductase
MLLSKMTHNILLIGGHGKVSQLLTPMLLAKSWNVTSMIRSPDQTSTIEELGRGQPGNLSVLVESVEDVKSEGDAKRILERVKPDWVVWSAGTYSSYPSITYIQSLRPTCIAVSKKHT